MHSCDGQWNYLLYGRVLKSAIGVNERNTFSWFLKEKTVFSGQRKPLVFVLQYDMEVRTT